jgi:hypothetical protein
MVSDQLLQLLQSLFELLVVRVDSGTFTEDRVRTVLHLLLDFGKLHFLV